MKRTHGLVVFLFAMLVGGCAASARVPEADSSVLRDSQGNAVRSTGGGCIAFPGEELTDPACLPEKEPDRIRITTIGIEPEYAGEETPHPTLSPEGRGENGRASPEGRGEKEWEEQVSVVTKTLRFVTDTPFGLNSAGLTDTMRRDMLAFLISLEPYFKVVNLEITGHGDASGSAHYNQWLSEKRAESARIYFRSLGVDPRMMTIRGAGETALLTTLEPTSAGQRRVEITAQVLAKP